MVHTCNVADRWTNGSIHEQTVTGWIARSANATNLNSVSDGKEISSQSGDGEVPSK